jgi:phospholipid/cholesterol/gamma-HCH transport system substrate-binding protein
MKRVLHSPPARIPVSTTRSARVDPGLRSRLAARPRRGGGALRASAHRVVVGIVGASTLLAGCGFNGLYSAPLPGGANLGSHPYTLTVEFQNVLDLVPQSAVKVNDVAVGKVESIKLDGWYALVKIKVNGDVRLPANAHAELQQTSLLGEKYVQLEQPPADPVGDLRDVTATPTIPIQRTGRNPELEEVLGALSLLLSGGGLPQIRTITHELNNALSGRTGAARDLIAQLNTFVGSLNRQKDSITTAIANLDALATRLDEQKQVLLNTLDTLPGALRVLNDERGRLVMLLRGLDNLGGAATRVIEATSDTFTSALSNLDPVLTSLTRAGQDLPNSLELLLTYPFPRAVSGAVQGDYTNLSAELDLNLRDLLSNLTAGSNGRTAQSARSHELPTVPGAR